MPRPVKWPEDGWDIQPDLIVQGPATLVPARPKNDVIEWSLITVPTGITKDTWITSWRSGPANLPSRITSASPSSLTRIDVKYNTPVWIDRPRDDEGRALPKRPAMDEHPPALRHCGKQRHRPNDGCYVPGQRIRRITGLHNAAKLIKAGTDFVFQVHYTPNGKDTTDRPRIGFTIAKEPPERIYVSSGMSSPNDRQLFRHSAKRSPIGRVRLPRRPSMTTRRLVCMLPHMHVRGKDMTYTFVYPDGRQETILHVPRYDFNWQLGYDLATPVKVTKGTKLVVNAHFDNSANNKFNPDPSRTVYMGTMTWEEMMFPFFSVVVDKSVDPRKVITVRVAAPDGA